MSIRNLTYVRDALAPFYGLDCPVIIAYRSTWPDENSIRTSLQNMAKAVREEKITRTALMIVGKVFEQQTFTPSSVYDSGFAHILRNKGKKKGRLPERGS